MDTIIDARGLECPEPAMRTGAALRDHHEVTVIVDSEASVRNIRGAVEKRGFSVEVERNGPDFHVHIAKDTGEGRRGSAMAGSGSSTGDTVVFLPSDQVGKGDEELGRILARAMVYSLTRVEPRPETMVLMNSGVKLAVEGSEVLDDLLALEAAGMRILVCGTCLDYYGLVESLAVGGVSNAYTIAETMLESKKVIRL